MFLRMTNKEIHFGLVRAAASERKVLGEVLSYVNEVESRKIYLEMGYPSLFEYLVKECQYSASAAMRRIQAAHLLRKVPLVSEKIQSGALNLSQVSELSRAVKEKEKSGTNVPLSKVTELVNTIAGKTTAETQKEISLSLDIELKAPETSTFQKDESVHLGLTLSKTQYENLMKCRDLLANTLLSDTGDVSLSSVVDALCDKYLNTKQIAKSAEENVIEKQNKTLTPKTKLIVLNRDRCCQYKDPSTGKTCGSTFNLQTDHKLSRWAGGGHELKNLQLLCQAHNNYKYEKERQLCLI